MISSSENGNLHFFLVCMFIINIRHVFVTIHSLIMVNETSTLFSEQLKVEQTRKNTVLMEI
jgi:hypothetical protein